MAEGNAKAGPQFGTDRRKAASRPTSSSASAASSNHSSPRAWNPTTSAQAQPSKHSLTHSLTHPLVAARRRDPRAAHRRRPDGISEAAEHRLRAQPHWLVERGVSPFKTHQPQLPSARATPNHASSQAKRDVVVARMLRPTSAAEMSRKPIGLRDDRIRCGPAPLPWNWDSRPVNGGAGQSPVGQSKRRDGYDVCDP